MRGLPTDVETGPTRRDTLESAWHTRPPRPRSGPVWWIAVVVVLGAAAVLASTAVGPLGGGPSAPAQVGPPTPADFGGASHELTAADVDSWLDGLLPTALATGDIAGAGVVVVKDGAVLTQRGFGYADIATRTPVDPQTTLFRPGSVSKLFTWTAVMQLVEQGRLDLDTDVNTYLDFTIPPREGGPVTLRTLMTHTAGFEEQFKDLLSFDPAAIPPRHEVVRRVPERIFAAGTTPAYSNYGAALAGYIVERVSGEPFPDYVQRHIFDPLGMRHSTFAQPLPDNLRDSMATGYSTASGEPIPFELTGFPAAGAMSASTADMARFMLAHLQGGELDGQRILRPETTALMHDTALTLLPPLNRMRLGFFETNINGREVIGHGGDTTAFHSALHLFPNERTGIYVVVNSTGKEGAGRTLRAQLFTEFADRYYPGGPRTTTRVDPATAAAHTAMMSGTWSAARRSESNFFSVTDLLGQVTVGAGRNGELLAPVLPGAAGQPRRWVEVEPFVWQDLDSHERLAAAVENGQVLRFSTDRTAPTTVYERTPWYKSSALLLPLLCTSLAILVLTVLMWPAGALIRRRLAAPLQLEGRQLLGYRLSRLTALLILTVLVGWVVTLASMLSGFRVTAEFDPLIQTLQLLSFLAFGGGLAVLLGWAWLTWRDPRRWGARLWSIALVLAGGVVLWIGTAYHLLSISTQY